MRFLTAYAILTLTIAKVWASGGEEHHASIIDLFAPAVNVGILVGVLVWKVKAPLKKYFDAKSDEVANTLERANLKSKEAKIMLEGENRKLSNLSSEINVIRKHAEEEVSAFEKDISKEIEERTQKLKFDANSKILADKKQIMDDLNAELLNQVISKTKSTIKTNKDYQNKVSTKLLQGL